MSSRSSSPTDSLSDFELPNINFKKLQSIVKPKKKLKDQDYLAKIKQDCKEYLAFKQTITIDDEIFKEKPSLTEESTINDKNSNIEPDLPAKTLGYKIFCTDPNLLYYNLQTVSLKLCGYDESDTKLSAFEKRLLSFDSAELSKVLSSCLALYHSNHITNYHAFISYLLQTLAFHEDLHCVVSCQGTLNQILKDFPYYRISFSDICKLFYNFGVNGEKCELLQSLPEFENPLLNQKMKFYQIPNTWTCNIDALLQILYHLIIYNVRKKELEKIVKLLLVISLDSTLLLNKLHISLKNCIKVALAKFSKEKWPKIVTSLGNFIATLNISNENKLLIIREIPDTYWRGIALRKEISFNILKYLIKSEGENFMAEESVNIPNLIKFVNQMYKIREKRLNEMPPFIDFCIGPQPLFDNLDQIKEFCDLIRKCSNLSFIEHKAKVDFLKLYHRVDLRVDKNQFVDRIFIKKEISEDDIPINDDNRHGLEVNSTYEENTLSIKDMKQEKVSDFEEYVFFPSISFNEDLTNESNLQSNLSSDCFLPFKNQKEDADTTSTINENEISVNNKKFNYKMINKSKKISELFNDCVDDFESNINKISTQSSIKKKNLDQVLKKNILDSRSFHEANNNVVIKDCKVILDDIYNDPNLEHIFSQEINRGTNQVKDSNKKTLIEKSLDKITQISEMKKSSSTSLTDIMPSTSNSCQVNLKDEASSHVSEISFDKSLVPCLEPISHKQKFYPSKLKSINVTMLEKNRSPKDCPVIVHDNNNDQISEDIIIQEVNKGPNQIKDSNKKILLKKSLDKITQISKMKKTSSTNLTDKMLSKSNSCQVNLKDDASEISFDENLAPCLNPISHPLENNKHSKQKFSPKLKSTNATILEENRSPKDCTVIVHDNNNDQILEDIIIQEVNKGPNQVKDSNKNILIEKSLDKITQISKMKKSSSTSLTNIMPSTSNSCRVNLKDDASCHVSEISFDESLTPYLEPISHFSLENNKHSKQKFSPPKLKSINATEKNYSPKDCKIIMHDNNNDQILEDIIIQEVIKSPNHVKDSNKKILIEKSLDKITQISKMKKSSSTNLTDIMLSKSNSRQVNLKDDISSHVSEISFDESLAPCLDPISRLSLENKHFKQEKLKSENNVYKDQNLEQIISQEINKDSNQDLKQEVCIKKSPDKIVQLAEIKEVSMPSTSKSFRRVYLKDETSNHVSEISFHESFPPCLKLASHHFFEANQHSKQDFSSTKLKSVNAKMIEENHMPNPSPTTVTHGSSKNYASVVKKKSYTSFSNNNKKIKVDLEKNTFSKNFNCKVPVCSFPNHGNETINRENESDDSDLEIVYSNIKESDDECVILCTKNMKEEIFID